MQKEQGIGSWISDLIAELRQENEALKRENERLLQLAEALSKQLAAAS